MLCTRLKEGILHAHGVITLVVGDSLAARGPQAVLKLELLQGSLVHGGDGCDSLVVCLQHDGISAQSLGLNILFPSGVLLYNVRLHALYCSMPEVYWTREVSTTIRYVVDLPGVDEILQLIETACLKGWLGHQLERNE